MPMLRQSLMKCYQATTALFTQIGISNDDIIHGELKSFDIHGNDIESQMTTSTRSDFEEEDEEMENLPSPHVSDDETVGDLEASAPPRKSRTGSARSKRSSIVK